MGMPPISRLSFDPCFSYCIFFILKMIFSSVPWTHGIPMPSSVYELCPRSSDFRAIVGWCFPSRYVLGFPEGQFSLWFPLLYNFVSLNFWISQASGNLPYLDVSMYTPCGQLFSRAEGSFSTPSDVPVQYPSGILLLLPCESCQDFKTKSCLSNWSHPSYPTCRAKAVCWSLLGSASSAFPFISLSYCFFSNYKIQLFFLF